MKNYRQEAIRQIYIDAQYANTNPALGNLGSLNYEMVWFAARRTAQALLEQAKELGLSDDHLEALRQVAAHVAPD